MPLPPNYNTGTVTGTFVTSAGVPVVGYVKFRPPVTRLVNDVYDMVIAPVDHIATLDANGSFSIDLPATNDPDINPLNFTYTVTEYFTNSRGQRYSIPVPMGVVTDLSEVVAVDSSTGTAYIVGPPGPPGGSNPSETITISTPASVWGPIVYTLTFTPAGIACYDTANTQVWGGITHNTSTKTITIDFTPASFAGKVILS